MADSALAHTPHNLAPARSGRALCFALLLWLSYFGALKLFRAALALSLYGEPTRNLTGVLYFLPIATAHALSFYVGWRALTRNGRLSLREIVAADLEQGRRWLEAFGERCDLRTALWVWSGIGLALWSAGTLLKLYFGGPASVFNEAATAGFGARLLVAALATVSAPLIEELFYRGFLYTQLERSAGGVAATMLVSLLFAAHHMAQYSTPSGEIIWLTVGIVFTHGLAMTLVRWRSRSLAPSVLMHATINGMNTVVFGLIVKYLF